MLGRALVRTMPSTHELITAERSALELTDQQAVSNFIAEAKPDAILVAAGRVGGIAANIAAPIDFLSQNLRIALNCIQEAHQHGITKLVYFGSACVFPKNIAQPMRVDDLMSGALEPSNRAYALAKLAGTELVTQIRQLPNRDYVTLMPSNLYGPHDNFDLQTSHVIPALIRKFVEAKRAQKSSVDIWGDGRAMREFTHVDDCARATWHLFERPVPAPIINVGSREEISITNLAHLIAEHTGFDGTLNFQANKPTGAPRRLLDSTLLHQTGWRPQIQLQNGLQETIEWYQEHYHAT